MNKKCCWCKRLYQDVSRHQSRVDSAQCKKMPVSVEEKIQERIFSKRVNRRMGA